ncbi:tryptophan-rich sensory protein TspO [Gymnodinialimonas sp.]
MDWSVFPLFLGACCAAATTGAMFSPGPWYRDLSKPSWTPPDWVFPITWTVLYIASAVAATRVALLDGNAHAMGWWAFQIALNTLWTPVFFGMERIKAGALVLVFLWISVAGSMWTFFQHDTLAGFLMVPYLVWVTIAGALNFSVWSRNPAEAAKG